MSRLVVLFFLPCLMNSYALVVSNITIPDYLFQHQTGYKNETSEIFIFGGVSCFSNKPNPVIYKRNISDNNGTWKNISAKMPSDTTYFVTITGSNSVTIDNLVYFVGIFNGSSHVNSVYLFNLTSEQFIENNGIATYPYMSSAGCVITNSSHIFYVGGVTSTNNGDVFLNYIQILDIKVNKWSFAEINIKFWRQLCAIAKEEIYVFGGATDNPDLHYLNSIYKYNVFSTEWTFIRNVSKDFRWGNAIYSSIDNNIYVRSYKLLIFSVAKERFIDEIMMPVPIKSAPMLIYTNTLITFGGSYYSWNPLIYWPHECTALTQSATLPLSSKMATCSQNKNGLNAVTIVMIVLWIISLIICCVSIVYCWKRKAPFGSSRFLGEINTPEGRIM